MTKVVNRADNSLQIEEIHRDWVFWNKLYNGDALEVLRTLPSASLQFAVTSPPYNAAHNYDGYDDNLEWEKYKDFLRDVITEIHRILVKGGRFAINVPFAVKNKKTKKVRFLATMIAGLCEELAFIEFEFITWHKGKDINHFQGNNTAWGSWKSPSNPVFRPLGEVVMVFSKEQTKLEGDKEKIDIEAEEFKNWTKNLWYINEEHGYENLMCIANNQNKKEHPCPYPEELVRRLLKLYTYKDNIILDPFNGIGTTTKVAKEMDRRFIGIEQSLEYCHIAAKSMGEAAGLVVTSSEETAAANLAILDIEEKEQNLPLINIEEIVEYKDLVNPSQIQQETVNRWFNFKESYSGKLVEQLIKRYKKEDCKRIIDPFMGAGSTLFKAYSLGIDSVGFDVNPISVLAAKVKTSNYDERDIKEIEDFIENLPKIAIEKQAYPHWDPLLNYISEEKLDLLLSYKAHIEKKIANEKVSDLLKILWLSMIEEVSDYKKDGNGIKKVNRNFPIDKIQERYREKLQIALEDISTFKEKNKHGASLSIINDSSMNIDKYEDIKDIEMLITSPPYANCFDYFEVYKVELWLGEYIKNHDDWRKLKKTAMRSNLNAKLESQDVLDHSYFTEIMVKINERVKDKRIKDKKIPIMLNNYFYDMRELLEKLRPKMKKGAIISIIVGNSAYGGVVIPTDEIIGVIGKSLGYQLVEIIKARPLRTSSQQMKIIEEKDKLLLRESIVTLKYT
ncbi:site-specific DNA-methyltransferase (adenine-specific) [Natronincola peptidivorans]|uniref:site-specific DNA-methyltransferase (cytosine-N(4)-specific) n=1 Tax=Natronincola peptidivorans TaxID=426128 RepID=A0A1I0DYB2_9FIRM|nr:DNA methyltransferase [Natronincola peptidivorans]SET37557.1 site-specific DNA-methyltransferase (adenine-specific) [Natronincola peptidivorans]